MEPTISIPQDWQYPRFCFGQRTERGTIIGLKYYASDTYLADEYGAGWRYILLANKYTEDESMKNLEFVKHYQNNYYEVEQLLGLTLEKLSLHNLIKTFSTN